MYTFLLAGYALIEQLEKQHTEQQQHLITVPQDIVDTKDRINRLLQIVQGKMTLVDESWIDVQKRSEDMKVRHLIKCMTIKRNLSYLCYDIGENFVL